MEQVQLQFVVPALAWTWLCPLGWDNAFATNHIGPFVLTEALIPHLPDGANVVFVASGVEDPERKPAKMTGFRGGRYISAEASVRREWEPGGSKMAGADAYADLETMHPRHGPEVCPRRGCASTRLSRDSVRLPASCAMPTSSCAS
jgi:NAD(P)-dependent dehydrogenase (short-subunit alcohol dehydrogenase family)